MPIQGNTNLDTGWDPENSSPPDFVRSTISNENVGTAPAADQFHLRELYLQSIVELGDTYTSMKDKINALAQEIDSLDHNAKKYVDENKIFTTYTEGTFNNLPKANILCTGLHGLNTFPRSIVLYFKCISPQYAYVVGDELLISLSQSDSGLGSTVSVTNETSIRYYITSNPMSYPRLSGNGVFYPANFSENWEFKFKAFA